jgi:hypothetical protein
MEVDLSWILVPSPIAYISTIHTINNMTNLNNDTHWKQHENHQLILQNTSIKYIKTFCMHGIIMDMLANTYWCVASCKAKFMRNLVPTPPSTSPMCIMKKKGVLQLALQLNLSCNVHLQIIVFICHEF